MTGGPDRTGHATGRTNHLAWRRTGPNPRIVLLHGFTDAGCCWDPWLDAFGGDVLTVDARGHGDSELPDGPISAAIQAADVAAVLDAFGRTAGGYVVIGHSMGAATTAELTRSRPDLVRAAVLEDPRGVPAAAVRAVDDWLTAVRAADPVTALELCRSGNPGWPEPEMEPWVRSKRQLDLAVFERPRPATTSLAEIVRGVSCPVRLVHGDPERGGIISPQLAEDCVVAAAGAVSRVHVAGAGHNVRRDEPAAYLAAVRPWVATALAG